MNIVRKIILKIKCKIGWHDPRVWGWAIDKNNKEIIKGYDTSIEMYYDCLYCPYTFWDHLKEERQIKVNELAPYEFEAEKVKKTK